MKGGIFRPGPKEAAKPAGPPLADIEEAIAQLRAPGAMCFVQLSKTNQGLSAELSFNSARSRTPSGQIELVLREAVIEVWAADADTTWSWNEALLETADQTSDIVEVVRSSNEEANSSTVEDLNAKVAGKGNVSALFAKAELGAEVAERRSQQRGALSTRGAELKVARVLRHIKVQRRDGNFRLEFSAGAQENLIDLNTKLNRLPLLDVPSPSELDLGSVRMDLHLSLDTAGPVVRHAFHVRQATGAWGQLASSHRRILAELLLSKFLPEIHEPQRIWPKASQP